MNALTDTKLFMKVQDSIGMKYELDVSIRLLKIVKPQSRYLS